LKVIFYNEIANSTDTHIVIFYVYL